MFCDCILSRETPYRGRFWMLGHQDHHSGPTAKETQKESKPADEEEEDEDDEIVRLHERLLLLLILGSLPACDSMPFAMLETSRATNFIINFCFCFLKHWSLTFSLMDMRVCFDGSNKCWQSLMFRFRVADLKMWCAFFWQLKLCLLIPTNWLVITFLFRLLNCCSNFCASANCYFPFFFYCTNFHVTVLIGHAM